MSVKKVLSSNDLEIFYNEYHGYLQKSKKTKSTATLKEFFNNLRTNYSQFKKHSDRVLSNQIIAARRVDGEIEWPNISQINNYISPNIRTFINKSHKSALLAIEVYNKPQIQYRSEGFIVFMTIAWTALFHAIFLEQNEKISYKESEKDYFDLRKCIKKYSGFLKNEIEANLTLLIDLRDIIVHRDNPIIDDRIFPHCQACLFNFEQILVNKFGTEFILKNALAYSLQFSSNYTKEQYESIKKYKTKSYYKVTEFIENYEKNLFTNKPNIYSSQNYAFRVYMIPKPVKSNNAEAAIEFINYDTTDEETKNKIDKIIFSIKETRTAGNYFKAGEVCSNVVERIKSVMPNGWKFSPSYHHSRCAKYFKIREGYKTDKPEVTKKEYCIYDPVFEQYIYTKQWIDFLCKKLKTKTIYDKIFKK